MSEKVAFPGCNAVAIRELTDACAAGHIAHLPLNLIAMGAAVCKDQAALAAACQFDDKPGAWPALAVVVECPFCREAAPCDGTTPAALVFVPAVHLRTVNSSRVIGWLVGLVDRLAG